MKVEVIYCDRCREKCEPIINDKGLILIRRTDGSRIDLCQECCLQLRAWMDGARLEYLSSEPTESEESRNG